ncbi:MAG: hypothetical protein LC105_02900 [Chitinophagales bacterium]|nr:hypothetical protein [Chitinophagales bacterium]MCZ2392789.1 hypothetical protein [Chitinophagales bacterium]
MRKIFNLFILLFISLSFTSCLDIIENINIHKNGSGEYSLKITINETLKKNMTQSLEAQLQESNKTEIESDEEGEDSYKASLEKIVNQLKEVKGLSNIKMFFDEEKFEYGYQYSFENLQALNQAMETTAGTYTPKIPENFQAGKKKKTFVSKSSYIEEQKNIVIRHQSAELGKILEMKKPSHSNAGMLGGLDISYILQDMSYTTIFQFNQDIKSVNNPAALVDENNHTVTISCKPFAYKESDLQKMKLQESACEQSIIIELK